MPQFPNPLPTPAIFAHPPLANVREVWLAVRIRYENWIGDYVPQLDDRLRATIPPLLRANHIDVSAVADAGMPTLHVELKIKALKLNQGMSGGFTVKTEVYLEEQAKLDRVECENLNVITWAHESLLRAYFRCPPSSEAVLQLEGEVHRQIKDFIADWLRDNANPPAAMPPAPNPPAPPPALPQPPHRPQPVPAGPVAVHCNLSRSWGFNVVHLSYCAGSPGFSNRSPGAYVGATASVFQRAAGYGANLFRFPLRWERLLPDLGGSLNDEHLTALMAMIQHAADVRGKVILDVHNSMEFVKEATDGSIQKWLVNQRDSASNAIPVKLRHLVHLWSKIAETFKRDDRIIGYGIMNQPPAPNAYYDGRDVCRQVVEAIRTHDRHKIVLIDNENYSYAEDWPRHQEPWIQDDKIVYEAHLDVSDPAASMETLLTPFGEWCARQRCSGFIGSVRMEATPEDRSRMLRDFRAAATRFGLGWCYWPASDDLDLKNVF